MNPLSQKLYLAKENKMHKTKKKTSSYNIGGVIKSTATTNYPAKDSIISRELDKEGKTKGGVMTYNIGGMVKSQVNNLSNKIK